MFTSFYNVLQSEIGKNLLSKFNLFNYSNVYIFKYTTVKIISFYKNKFNNLSLVVKQLNIRWGLFFYKNILILLLVFLLG